MAKFIFVTGGVVSGLGKGITAASLGRLLKCRGLKVASQKLDPYVNVDPGTMSPLQHGEVFVTDDGTETDLDLGHYERFIDENLNKYSNLTTGKVYWNVLNKERQGAYLGQTVQIIPHITNEIKSYIYNLASSTEADVVITEIGGTTGDIESQPFLEAIRQVGLEQGKENCCFIHVVHIVENYTRESGVRELEKKINKVMRKIALEFARDGYEVMHEIKPADVRKYLGTPEYSRDKYQGNEYAGVVTGLAWTAVGGEILFVETSLSKGKGGKLTLTGNLGDVMKESAMLALEYLKAHTKLLNLQEDIFDNWNIHIHVPEGAIPKDGPSAGITMVTSLASALTQRKVKANLAMTGEITLRGKVLPVGGIKEKILAAKRAGIKDIILCEENRKNIEEIQPMYLEGLTFHYVTDIKEVLALALTNEKVNGAIDFNITNQKTEEKK